MRSIGIAGVIAAGLLAIASPLRAQDASWNGTWSGLWDGKGATSVTITDGKVAQYVYLGRSYHGFDVKIAGDAVSFKTDNDATPEITLKKTEPNKAQAEFTGRRGYGTATLTRF